MSLIKIMREIVVPPSKSISNRVLLLGLYQELSLFNLLKSDDTKVMLDVLPKLGVEVLIVNESEQAYDLELRPCGQKSDQLIELYVENAGTATRFLTAALAFLPGEYRLHGTERMHERPINDLVDGLTNLGAEIEYENTVGFLPLVIKGKETGVDKKTCQLKQNVSSQYLSGLLLSAPFWSGETIIRREGEIVSQSYVELTLGLLKDLGIKIDFNAEQNSYLIKGGQNLNVAKYRVEPDYSSASYWIAASALTGEEVLLNNLSLKSLQGDLEFLKVMIAAGLKVEEMDKGLKLLGADKLIFNEVIDCVDFPDAAMTLVIVIAVSGQKVQLKGLANLRVKECDRLMALRLELAKVGVAVEETDDGLIINGVDKSKIMPAEIETYNDHRMAMCFAVLQLINSEIKILDPDCVSKTYPTFWQDWMKSDMFESI